MNFIRHRKMKDVCFQVYKQRGELVKGMWWNTALGEPFPLVEETIRVKDPENWGVYVDARAAKTNT